MKFFSTFMIAVAAILANASISTAELMQKENINLPTKLVADNSSSMTMSQKNAIKSAQTYLIVGGLSRKGLVTQLSSEYGEKYPLADAEFAVSYLEKNNLVDWNEQAYKAAKVYLSTQGFSKDALYEQLISEYGDQFTPEQAKYAIKKVGY